MNIIKLLSMNGTTIIDGDKVVGYVTFVGSYIEVYTLAGTMKFPHTQDNLSTLENLFGIITPTNEQGQGTGE